MTSPVASTSVPTTTPPARPPVNPRWLFGLCLFAALHVFLFAAGLPFFNNVDEPSHVDLVIRYSQGDVPRNMDFYSAGARPFLVAFNSLEYLYPANLWPRDLLLYFPAWKAPPEKVRAQFSAADVFYKHTAVNHEDSQPPLYYLVAGAWWRLGTWLHLDGLALLYWLRWLNMILVAALVWLAGKTATTLFPDRPFIGLAVPALVACMPQSVFYGVNNDIASPLAFGLVFLLLFRGRYEGPLSLGQAVGFGLALAATFLAKISNLPFLIVAVLFAAWRYRNAIHFPAAKRDLPSLGLLVLGAALPIGLWMAWCRRYFGDLTGSLAKVHLLGWTNKPIAEWFHNPIFTLAGGWSFLSQNIVSFWQGELVWYGQRLRLPAVDQLYLIVTIGGLLAAVIAASRHARVLRLEQSAAVWFGTACVVAGGAFLTWLSLRYDFQACIYPSRQIPYFTSGRLLLGMLVPAILVLGFGLDEAMKRSSTGFKYIVLTAFLGFMLVSEITTDLPVFASPANWFHN